MSNTATILVLLFIVISLLSGFDHDIIL